MPQINVFRMKKTYMDSTAGFLELMGDELRELSHSDTDILEHTDVVIVPDEALHPWSDYKHQDAYDPELEDLVNDELEYQRVQNREMTVSVPMYWIRQETETEAEEHWQLRFQGRVIANVVRNMVDENINRVEAYYNDYEDNEIHVGNYGTIREAMEALHSHFGRNA